MNAMTDTACDHASTKFAPGSYAAVVEQDGYGCDYTIGCGELTIPLVATTVEDAKREAAAILHEDHSYPRRDLVLKRVLIVTVTAVMSNDDVLLLVDASDDEEEDEATAARRREYERLKKEFG